MSDWTQLNECRVPPEVDKAYGTRPSDGFEGLFHLVINGLRVKCIASDGMGWKHVSVSISGNVTQTPSWQIMCKVKDLFWEPEDWVVQFHPARSQYVNTHPGVLHLWQPTSADLPRPNALMVGIKDDATLKKVMEDESIPLSQRLLNKSVYLFNKAIGNDH